MLKRRFLRAQKRDGKVIRGRARAWCGASSVTLCGAADTKHEGLYGRDAGMSAAHVAMPAGHVGLAAGHEGFEVRREMGGGGGG